MTDLWELLTSFRQRAASPLLLIRGVFLLLASAVLVFARSEAIRVFLNVLAGYLVLDGLGYLASAAVKSGRLTPRSVSSVHASGVGADLVRSPRAIVFVRRYGAKGMGHVGWGFEWRTRWFNAGSVENRSNAAFTAPDKMDFWSTHTLHPVATTLEHPPGYDAFKVFSVSDPQAKAAWNTIVWLSRQPYSVLRRNCADCVCDVLRAYGVAGLVDTAQENVPNRWYDALPGPSYPIRDYPEIPLDPAKIERLAQLPVSEIKLSIPTRIKVAPPPWRVRGGRAWYELRQRWRKTMRRARALAHTASRGVRASKDQMVARMSQLDRVDHPPS